MFIEQARELNKNSHISNLQKANKLARLITPHYFLSVRRSGQLIAIMSNKNILKKASGINKTIL